MSTVPVFNMNREEVGSVELNSAVFGAPVREHLFHAAVRYQLAKRRAGTHATKGRASISGGGKKPFRQKGTGRARQGTTRAPHWRGGGVVHGPHFRSHAHSMPKKMRRAALISALSRRAAEGSVVVLDELTLPEIKTRQVADLVQRFELDKVLVVLAEKDDTVVRSARNIPGVTVLPVGGLNVYDVLRHNTIALTKDALAGVVERLGA
jgi:large subunit ribosomal protein L4